MKFKILIVLSSCDRIPGTERGTGTWLEELAAPYYVFRDADAQVELASVAGGRAPLDPTSEEPEFQTEATQRFTADPQAQRSLASTSKLAAIRPDLYDAVFYSGGLGPVFDLSEDAISIGLIEAMHRAGKPIAAVCHGTAVLRNVHDPQGISLVKGRAVTGFSNSEEMATNGPGVVPFSIENELRRLGGRFSAAADGQPHVVADGTLITGQNPASSEGTARKVLELIPRASTKIPHR
ncbi:MAG: type 1 glutamine amidotransferase domain-containing protein [Steroidobacteraceae bacterium]